MLDINRFESVFSFNPSVTYAPNLYQQIEGNRRGLQGKLFFDRLLDTLQVKGVKYPPKTNHDLREIHQKIVSAPIADHHKQSLLYYILLDCKSSSEIQPAEDFSRKCHMPQKYWVCLQGLWNMDRMQFQAALDSLTQPTLLPTYSSEILSTLLSQHSTNSDDTIDLPIAWYNTMSPPLVPDSLLEAYFRHLALTSVTSAYDLLQLQSPHMHRKLFQLLIETALRQTYSADKEARVRKAVELVDLPFTEEEVEWFEEFLMEGQGRNISGAGDVVALRRVATGRVSDAIAQEDALSARRADGVNWDSLRDGLGKGLGPRKDGVVFKMTS